MSLKSIKAYSYRDGQASFARTLIHVCMCEFICSVLSQFYHLYISWSGLLQWIRRWYCLFIRPVLSHFYHLCILWSGLLRWIRGWYCLFIRPVLSHFYHLCILWSGLLQWIRWYYLLLLVGQWWVGLWALGSLLANVIVDQNSYQNTNWKDYSNCCSTCKHNSHNSSSSEGVHSTCWESRARFQEQTNSILPILQ